MASMSSTRCEARTELLFFWREPATSVGVAGAVYVTKNVASAECGHVYHVVPSLLTTPMLTVYVPRPPLCGTLYAVE